VDFQAHLTALTLSSSFDFTPEFSSHLSVGWSELRLRNLTYSSQYLIEHPTPVPPDKIQKSTFGGTLGLEYSANPHTHSIVEAGALPQLKFSDDLKTIDLNTVWYGMAGLRFFFTPNTSVDAAIRYRGDYSGLSDAEIRVGVNLGIDVFGSVKKKKMEI